MEMIEKTDGNGNVFLVEDPDRWRENGYFGKKRKRVTNFTPKKKKRKRNKRNK